MTIHEQVRAACLKVLSRQGEVRAAAFMVSSTVAITAAHADVQNFKIGATVQLMQGQLRFEATLEAINPSTDIAILRLAESQEALRALPFSFDVQLGDQGYAYGFPAKLGGAGLTVDLRIQDPRFEISGAAKPLLLASISGNIAAVDLLGFSGAPIVVGDAVVGFVVRTFHDIKGLVGAVRIQDALEMLPAREYARATLGVNSADFRLSPPGRGATGRRATVAVIAALDEELDYLLDLPYQWSGPQITEDGVTYRSGRMDDGADIVAASANSMGLTATAILTAKFLKEWSPRLAAMIGICGGRKEKGVAIGDVVVPTQTFHYQFGAIKEGKIHRELRVENSDPQLLDIVSHLTRRTDLMLRIKQSVPRGFPRPREDLRCHLGPMASADLVVKDIEKFGEAIEADRKTIAIEMESYAFMKAAALAHTRWVLVAKSVSDYADAEKSDDYRDYAKLTSTQLFVEVARVLLSSGHISGTA